MERLTPDMRKIVEHANRVPLVRRLRGEEWLPGVHYVQQTNAWMREAADRIDDLEANIAALAAELAEARSCLTMPEPVEWTKLDMRDPTSWPPDDVLEVVVKQPDAWVHIVAAVSIGMPIVLTGEAAGDFEVVVHMTHPMPPVTVNHAGEFGARRVISPGVPMVRTQLDNDDPRIPEDAHDAEFWSLWWRPVPDG